MMKTAMTLFNLDEITYTPQYVFDYGDIKNYEVTPTLWKNTYIGVEVKHGWVVLLRYKGRGKWRMIS